MKNKKTKQANHWLIAGTLIFLVLGLRQLYREHYYSVTLKDQFITSCNISADNKPYCRCVWKELKQEYSLEEFFVLNQAILLSVFQTPPRYGEIKESCAKQEGYTLQKNPFNFDL